MYQPMERRRRDFDVRSPFKSFFWVTRDVILEPEAFFRQTRGGDLGGPTLYLLVAVLLLGLIFTLFLAPLTLLVGIPVAQEEGFATTAGALLLIVAGVVALFLIFSPLLAVAFAFLGAALWHPFVALTVGIGRNAGFRETYRVSAYANGLTQLASLPASFVPFVGPLLALGLGIYVSVLGIKGAHETTTTRAIISVAIPVVFGFLLLVGFVAGLLFFLDSQGAFDQSSGGP